MADHDRKMLDEIAEDERWLAVYSTPAPSSVSVERAKAAAREAARLLISGQTGRTWRVWQGIAGVAAAIALCVFVGWRASQDTNQGETQLAMLDPMPVLPEQSYESITRISTFDEELSDLEDWSVQASWGVSGASLFEIMDEAMDEESLDAAGENGSS